MSSYSFLRLYKRVEDLEGAERDYWLKYINKREHLKREYPEGIPMKIIYPEGIFNTREKHGSYHVDLEGNYYVSSSDLDGFIVPGPQEVPLPWYLLFLEAKTYFRNTREALETLEMARNRITRLLKDTSFNLVTEKASVYFLQECNTAALDSFLQYLGEEEPSGFMELNYGEVAFLIDPIFADRIELDKKKLIFPGQIVHGLDALEKGDHARANDCFEEITIIHSQIRSAEDARMEMDVPFDPFL